MYTVPDKLEVLAVAGIEKVQVSVAPEAMRSCMVCLAELAVAWFTWDD